MYAIRYQKMKKTADGLVPANAYTLDQYDDMVEFHSAVVDIAQFRKRGYKYRLMDVAVDGNDITLRFDWQKSAPTE